MNNVIPLDRYRVPDHIPDRVLLQLAAETHGLPVCQLVRLREYLPAAVLGPTLDALVDLGERLVQQPEYRARALQLKRGSRHASGFP